MWLVTETDANSSPICPSSCQDLVYRRAFQDTNTISSSDQDRTEAKYPLSYNITESELEQHVVDFLVHL